jgi:hypothetical protein
MWLRAIVSDRDKLADLIAGGVRQFVAENAPAGAAGQVLRVAQRFGLVAMAGELATHYGVTGWPKGEATQAARRCFAAWLDSFGGTGNREDRVLLAQVRGFFETHGASRFEGMSAPIDQRIVNRAGFYRSGADGTREFLVLPEAFKRDVCAGFDLKAATRCLLAQGWIVPGGDGRPTQKPRLPGIGTARVYAHEQVGGNGMKPTFRAGRTYAKARGQGGTTGTQASTWFGAPTRPVQCGTRRLKPAAVALAADLLLPHLRPVPGASCQIPRWGKTEGPTLALCPLCPRLSPLNRRRLRRRSILTRRRPSAGAGLNTYRALRLVRRSTRGEPVFTERFANVSPTAVHGATSWPRHDAHGGR